MAHPYTLQAVSYGFDSLFMDVILTYTISAALLVNQGRGWRLVGAAFLLQLLLLNLYQPGANGFLVMTVCLLPQYWGCSNATGPCFRCACIC